MYREIIEDYSAIPRFLQQQYGLDKGKNHGRIWRLLPDDARLDEAPDFADAEVLVQLLDDDNPWRRRTAQRLLIARQATAAKDPVAKMVGAKSTTAPGKIAALYTLSGLDLLEPEHVSIALSESDYRVRLHGLRLMQEEWLTTHQSMFAGLFGLVDDPDPSVRLQLALTLGDIDDDRATAALLHLAQRHGEERWMPAAILSSSNTPQAGDLLESLLRLPNMSEGARRVISPLAVTVSGRRDHGAIARSLSALRNVELPVQLACLSGLNKGLALGAVDWSARLTPFFDSESPEIVELAMKLTTHLPLRDKAPLRAVFAAAERRALDRDADIAIRQQALRLLSNAEFEAVSTVAAKLLDATHPPAMQQAAITALAQSPDPRVRSRSLESVVVIYT